MIAVRAHRRRVDGIRRLDVVGVTAERRAQVDEVAVRAPAGGVDHAVTRRLRERLRVVEELVRVRAGDGAAAGVGEGRRSR